MMYLAYTVVGGVPSKKIRSRFKNNEDIIFHEKMLREKNFVGRLCAKK